jgi:hypothetical protein
LFENAWPFQIGESPQRVVFMFQWNRLVRVIDMGSALPEFAGPFYFGKSSGSWSGDVLVVHVIGVRGDVMLDSSGLPHGEDMKLTERFRLADGGKNLQLRLHFEDPEIYTRPWDAVLTFNRQPETSLVEDNCLDRANLPLSYRPTLSRSGAQGTH